MTAPYIAGDSQETTHFSNGANGSSVGYPVTIPTDWVSFGGSVTTYTLAHGEEAEIGVDGIYRVSISAFIAQAWGLTAAAPVGLNFIARVWSTSSNSQKTVKLMGGWQGIQGTVGATVNCGATLELETGDRVSIYAQVANGAVRIKKNGWGSDVEGTTASLVKVG